MKNWRRKITSVVLTLVIALTMMSVMAVTAAAADTSSKPTIVMLKAETSGTKAVKLSWNKVANATEYVIYGNQSGKKLKKLTTTTSRKYTVKKIKGTKLSANKYYKFRVVAYDGSTKLTKSRVICFITNKTSGKYANASGITPTKKTLEIEVGETAKVGVKVKIYKDKKHIKSGYGAATTYSSSNPAVASVTSAGKVEGISPGIATIYIQDISGLYCSTTVVVNPTTDPEKMLYTVSFDMQGHGEQVAPITDLEYQSKVSAPATEPTTPAYVFGGWYKEAACKNAWDFNTDVVNANTVLYAKWTEKTKVKVPTAKTDLVYDGGLQVGVSSGANYSISGNIATEAGTYYALVSLKNKEKYCWKDGTIDDKIIEWSIVKEGDIVVSLKKNEYEYSGSTIAPQLTVRVGSTTLTSKEYTVTWNGNLKDVGTYKGTVTAKDDNYSGVAIVTVQIVPKKIASSYAVTGLTYDGNQKTGVTSGTGYTVTGNTATNAGTYTATATLVDTKNTCWEDGSTSAKSISWIIRKAAITSVTADHSQYQYSGTAVNPTLVVKAGNLTLSASDYNVTWSGNLKDAGTHTATATAKGDNFTGSGSVVITIKASTDITATVDNDSYEYTGSAVNPRVTVKAGGTAMSSSDYDLVWKGDLKSVGTHTGTVTAKGNYAGTVVVTVTITKRKVTVPVAASDLIYDGSQKTGVAGGADYTISGNTATDAGTYTATVDLIDKDTTCWSDGRIASKSIKWTIAASGNVRAKVDQNSYVYSGEMVSPVLTVTSGGITLNASDYNVKWDDTLRNAGTYRGTISVTNSNYSGSATVTITIEKAAPTVIDDYKITYHPNGGSIVVTQGKMSVNGKINFVTTPTHDGACEIQFTPDDSANYNTVNVSADVTIDNTATAPEIKL